MADLVQLTDLDVITRYSIAVRTASADRAELIAALRADLAWLQAGQPEQPAASRPAKRAAPRKRTAKAAGARTRSR